MLCFLITLSFESLKFGCCQTAGLLRIPEYDCGSNSRTVVASPNGTKSLRTKLTPLLQDSQSKEWAVLVLDPVPGKTRGTETRSLSDAGAQVKYRLDRVSECSTLYSCKEVNLKSFWSWRPVPTRRTWKLDVGTRAFSLQWSVLLLKKSEILK